MEIKQTAVEWLFEKVANTDWSNMQGEEKLVIFEQSKQMNEKEIVNAFDEGKFEGRFNGEKRGEQYYNETYGK